MTTTPTSPALPVQPAPATPAAIAARPAPDDRADRSIWTAARVIALVLTVIETLLLARFALVLFGANASQPIVALVYGITAPLVSPFRGIFGQPEGPPTFEVATLLAVIFFLLVGGLVVAGVRAITGRRTGPRSTL